MQQADRRPCVIHPARSAHLVAVFILLMVTGHARSSGSGVNDLDLEIGQRFPGNEGAVAGSLMFQPTFLLQIGLYSLIKRFSSAS